MPNCSISKGESCSACLRLQALQSKIRECKEPRAELYIQEAHTKSSVNAAHDPIIRRLPLELVSNIFIFCNPNPVHTAIFSSPLANRPPFASWRNQISLGTVCTAWRNIVRSTPQLWTTICIRLQFLCESPQMEFLLLCLQLSGSLPLHIYAWVPWHHEPHEEHYPMLISLLEALNNHSERWKTLDLSMTPRLASRVKWVFPTASILEHLKIDCSSPGPPTVDQCCVSFGLSAPRVVDACEISFTSLGISWKNVTHVQLGELDAKECLTLFQQATQLVDLEIFLLQCWGSDLSDLGEVVTAPNLKSWKIESNDNPDMLLRKICLPSLVHLEFQEFTYLDSLEHMVTRSNCPLQTIYLGEAEGEKMDIIPIFRATPLMEEITFINPSSHGIHGFLDLLARTKEVNDLSQDSFLPRLKSLSLIYMDYDSPPWHLVPSLFPPAQCPANVQYRPLQTLKIHISIDFYYFEDEGYIDKNVVLQLMEIKRRGYDLITRNGRADDFNADFIETSYDHHFRSQTGTGDNSEAEDGEEWSDAEDEVG